MTPKYPAHLLELSYWWPLAPGDLLRTPETRPQSWVLLRSGCRAGCWTHTGPLSVWIPSRKLFKTAWNKPGLLPQRAWTSYGRH